MQRTYFLGGASPAGFHTDFWREHRSCYGYYLKGGPGTGKSTLMKAVAAAFAGEPVSCWHCASDPRSLDAVVLEERGVFVADATAPHEASTPLPYVTGETVDLAAGLSSEPLLAHQPEILRLYQENQSAHGQVRKGLGGIAELEAIIGDAGSRALQTEKLRSFTARLCKRLLPKASGQTGDLLYRQSMAITPAGLIRYLPEDYDLILLHDPFRTAGTLLLSQFADYAAEKGAVCEVTQALTWPDFPPVTLILPQQRLILALVTDAAQPGLPVPVNCIRMQRFYDPALLRRHRSLIRFCSKTIAKTEQKITELLADALQIHDELETYYIRSLDPQFLDRKAEAVIRDIRRRF